MIRFGTSPIAGSNDHGRTIGGHIGVETRHDDTARIGFGRVAIAAELDPTVRGRNPGLSALGTMARDAGLAAEAMA
jgi:hypothetical protein